LVYHSNLAAISDIQLIESFSKAEPGKENILTKSGYNLIPYVDNYYPQHKKTIRFYTEIYNTSKVLPGEVCLLTYHIETYEQKRIMEKFRGFSRRETAEVIPLLGEFPIETLPSGNYNLTVEVRNKRNEILAFKQSYFVRFSPTADSLQAGELEKIDIENTFAAAITNRDSLAEYILSLRPISSSQEIAFHQNQLKAAKTEIMQKFFFDFWQKRNPENPEQAWLAYNEEVKKVNAEFSTKTFKGYETERGRVYLKYGPPNTRTKEYHEPSAYPYEIWHYYKIANQQNRKFIFYNTDLVTNNFTILYSDVTGEQTGNKNWQAELHKRDTPLKDDSRDYNQRDFTPGNNVFKNFENPR
jgi:GWxTD domain-containing protein